MRTKRTILLAVLLTLALSFSLSGCFLFNDMATKVELTQTPKTQYVVGEDLSNVTFALSVTQQGQDAQTVSFKVGDENQNGVYIVESVTVKLEGFSTDAAGNFTATLTVNNGEATCKFDYVVVAKNESGFAGGNGSVNDPYQIATAEQFANIVLKGDQSKYTYYKLVADIDFSTVNFNELKNDDGKTYNQLIDCGYAVYPRVPLYSFNGSLDGAAGSYNFKLKNFTATMDNVSLFGNIANGSFTNIDVSGFNTVGHRAGAFGSNAYYKADGIPGATVSFKNVNILSNCKLSFGGYLAQTKKTANAAFENCEMAGAIISDGNNVGGFVGATTDSTSVTFTNCIMSGSVSGFDYVGAYAGYVNNSATYAVNFVGCTIAENAQITYYGTPGKAYKTLYSYNDNVLSVKTSNCVNNGKFEFKNNKSFGEGLPITVSGSAVTINKAPSTEGGYYRIMYLGQFDHYVLNATTNTFEYKFNGGYMTPMWVSDKLTKDQSVTYYDSACSYLPASLNITYRSDMAKIEYVTTSNESVSDKVFYKEYKDGDVSLLLYKKIDNNNKGLKESVALYVFEYNAAGEVIAMAKNA